MLRLDKDMYIESMPMCIYKELVDALNKDSNWMVLADHVADELEYPRSSWRESMKERTPTCVTNSPAEKLLFELNIQMCNVGMLYTLLKDCGLFRALSTLSEPEPLNIVTHPMEHSQNRKLEVPFGKSVLLCCKAIGLPPPSYLWYHNDMALANCESEILEFVITSTCQEGEYKCKVLQIKNDGTVLNVLTSNVIIVKITATPVVIEQQPVPFLEVKNGDSLTISCKAQSHPAPHYQWFRDNTKLEGETSMTLHIEGFGAKDEGKYYCYICNDVSDAHTERSHVILELPRQKAVAKVALIIANGEYEYHECLPTPQNDAAKIANLLQEIGFKVICLMNLSTSQMITVMKIFSQVLSEGVYGLFYFAGHGFKMQESYMLAVDAPKIYLRKDAICESELLAMFLQNDPALLVIILDMCQTVPPKEFNPSIHNEVPRVNEYKSRKNLRNLIQAYSTSSHRPSYERANSKYGLYMLHLSKYIDKNIPVAKVFEEVGKSVDVGLRGTERNQIPMFALTITKPFRLTDAVYTRNPPDSIDRLYKLTSFKPSVHEISFKQTGIRAKVTISPCIDPYLNLIKVTLSELENIDVNFFNSVPAKRNNLYQNAPKKECWIQNPQMNKGPLVIAASENGTPIGATLLHIKNHIPPLLHCLHV